MNIEIDDNYNNNNNFEGTFISSNSYLIQFTHKMFHLQAQINCLKVLNFILNFLSESNFIIFFFSLLRMILHFQINLKVFI